MFTKLHLTAALFISGWEYVNFPIAFGEKCQFICSNLKKLYNIYIFILSIFFLLLPSNKVNFQAFQKISTYHASDIDVSCEVEQMKTVAYFLSL